MGNPVVISAIEVPNSRATITYYEPCEDCDVTRLTAQAAIVWDESAFHPRSKFKIDHFWLTLPRRVGNGKLFSFVRATVESIEGLA